MTTPSLLLHVNMHIPLLRCHIIIPHTREVKTLFEKKELFIGGTCTVYGLVSYSVLGGSTEIKEGFNE